MIRSNLSPAIDGDSNGTFGSVCWLTVHRYATRPIMPDRSDDFRRAAQECLQLARATSDPTSQKWFDLANEAPGQARLDAAIQEFNAPQMEPKSVVQQQQQIPRRQGLATSAGAA